MDKEELIKTGEALLAAKQQGYNTFHEIEDILPENMLSTAEQWMEDLVIFQAKAGGASTLVLECLPVLNGDRFFPEKVVHILHI